MAERTGAQTVALTRNVSIAAGAAVVGSKEGEGPLRERFDEVGSDAYFGQKSWEKAESVMLRRCFDLLCNRSSTVDGIIRILKTKLVPSEYSPEDDKYIQRYMAAALLKGAVNSNAYAPEEPYTVELCASPNGVQDSPLMGGTTYYLYILAHGWDSEQRAVDVFQPAGSTTYKVCNCPSTYTQCKNIMGTWAGLK